jgi:hypothetical protein
MEEHALQTDEELVVEVVGDEELPEYAMLVDVPD